MPHNKRKAEQDSGEVRRRDPYLAELGYEVVRIPGDSVLRAAAGVPHRIEQAIDPRCSQLDSRLSPSDHRAVDIGIGLAHATDNAILIRSGAKVGNGVGNDSG
ncbi:hypothetical protein [Novipirellula galeiformis]|uniref:hypothetical protein n=1 Tax=Novipirellula galeiformis TaxID=2528004 RepID=UPI0011B62B9B|nr:hypothetical protein [Novipirellula galeiformis]